ncbi:phosphate ABC transporter permease PstA [Candidatus Foliamicus sp.]
MEWLFRAWGAACVLIGLGFLLIILGSIASKASKAFTQTYITLEVNLDPALLFSAGEPDSSSIAQADYDRVLRDALSSLFPEVRTPRQRRALYAFVSLRAPYQIRDMLVENPILLGRRIELSVLADDALDMWVKDGANRQRARAGLSPQQLQWAESLLERGLLERRFNSVFFTSGDSREPEMAGILAAVKGSAYMLVLTLLVAFPLGVASAVYLEEFAPRNRLIELAEANINSLAAMPSIIFGLLGLALFINLFQMPTSAPVVGGLTLALIALPNVILSAREAIAMVPKSDREAALALGSSRVQMVVHHVLPQAAPGIAGGAVVALARVAGEAAPLLMLGMVAFLVDPPLGFSDPSTALPVQIFMWAGRLEPAFVERTAAAILVLLAFLLALNLVAALLRSRSRQPG